MQISDFTKFRNRHSWITWGLSTIVIIVTVQLLSVDANDVVSVGGSDEGYHESYHYERNEGRYQPPPPPPPRPSSSRQYRPPPRDTYRSEEHYVPAPPAPKRAPPPPPPPPPPKPVSRYASRQHSIESDEVLSGEKEEVVVQDVGRPKAKPMPTRAPPKQKPAANVVKEFAPHHEEEMNQRRRQRYRDQSQEKFEVVSKTSPNAEPSHRQPVQPVKTPHKVKEATPYDENRNENYGYASRYGSYEQHAGQYEEAPTREDVGRRRPPPRPAPTPKPARPPPSNPGREFSKGFEEEEPDRYSGYGRGRGRGRYVDDGPGDPFIKMKG